MSQFKVGDKIVVIKASKDLRYGSSSLIENSIKYNFCMEVYWETGTYFSAKCDALKSHGPLNDHPTIASLDCRLATEEEIAASPENIETCITQYYEELKDYVRHFREDIYDGSKYKGKSFNTWFNTFQVGKWNQEKNKFQSHRGFQNVTKCCMNTMTQSDLRIFVPEEYIRFYGYSVDDFKNWLEFLKNCEMNFTYVLEPKVKPLLKSLRSFQPREHLDGYALGLDGNEISVIPFDNFLRVRVAAGNSQKMTYFYFICIRYMFSHWYYKIPKRAMHIKETLGDQITHFQALMMAHLERGYYHYYSLCANQPTVIDPFQTTFQVLEQKFKENRTVNGSPVYTSKITQERATQLFETNSYQEIIDIFKTN